jgi:hypothetical protein
MGDEEEEQENRRAPPFDSAFEVQTIKPNRRVRFQRPEIRSADQTQTHSVNSLAMSDAIEAAAVRELLRKWNAGKQAEPGPLRKIVLDRRTIERNRKR